MTEHPFYRMLVAQALAADCALVNRDDVLARFSHRPPPLVSQRLRSDVRIVSAGAQRERPLASWNEFGHKDTISSNKDLIAFEHAAEELGEIDLWPRGR